MPGSPDAAPPRAAVARVREVRTLPHPDYCELEAEAPHVARTAAPGQFVHVRIAEDAGGALLRRPFSIAGCEGDVLRLLFKKVGKLTRRLARLAPGDALDILGPLGRGYDLTVPPAAHAVLVAGGYGVAPLLLLARTLRERGLAGRVHFLLGARTADQLLWRDRLAREAWRATRVATDDGSAGRKGTVLGLFEEVRASLTGSIRVYACGPMRMLGALAAGWPDLPLQAAVENQMGCGLGVCVGCVLPVAGATGYDRYVRICCDGPVFDGRLIDWAACPS